MAFVELNDCSAESATAHPRGRGTGAGQEMDG
jgi:hypothetical protein